jgi:hypothetical protein
MRLPRKATILVIAWNVVMLLALLVISTGQATVDGQADAEWTQLGRGILALGLFFVWFVGFCITGMIWLMSRPNHQ